MFRHTLSHRIVLVCLLLFMFAGLPVNLHVTASPSAQGCSPPECYEPPPDNPPPSGEGGVWDGYSDGRLNPDMAEYYTIYCENDLIEVWGGVPSPQLVKSIPLSDAIALAVGHEQPLGNFVVMQRTSEDIITIYGSNGNRAPESGSKSFVLSECVAHNGGLPAPPPAPANPRLKTTRTRRPVALRKPATSSSFATTRIPRWVT